LLGPRVKVGARSTRDIKCQDGCSRAQVDTPARNPSFDVENNNFDHPQRFILPHLQPLLRRPRISPRAHHRAHTSRLLFPKCSRRTRQFMLGAPRPYAVAANETLTACASRSGSATSYPTMPIHHHPADFPMGRDPFR